MRARSGQPGPSLCDAGHVPPPLSPRFSFSPVRNWTGALSVPSHPRLSERGLSFCILGSWNKGRWLG